MNNEPPRTAADSSRRFELASHFRRTGFKRARGAAWAPLSLTVLLCLGCPTRTDGTGGGRDCEVNSDCGSARPLCVDSICVECGADTDCDCTEVCEGSVCETFRAADGFCAANEDCGFGEICSALTQSCVVAADFDVTCAGSSDCPNGLACDPGSQTCLPAAACRSNHNCCGVPDVSCQSTDSSDASLCIAFEAECTPPLTTEQACPFRPRLTGECSDTNRFCDPAGRCVECVCDADCDGLGFGICDDGTCVGCIDSSDCVDPGTTCDPLTQVCAGLCQNTTDCLPNEFCDTETSVCRSLQDRLCTADALEPNDSLSAAQSNSVRLQLPDRGGGPVARDGLTLCTGDVADWFELPLERGDRLQIVGSTTTPLVATMRAIGPDGVTVVENGSIDRSGNDPIDFVANFDDTYFLAIEQQPGVVGSYVLNIERSAAAAQDLCDDPAETTRNDSVASASRLNDPDAPLPSCRINGAIGASQTIECAGNPQRICLGEADYYAIDAPVGATVSTTVSGSTPDLDANLYGPFIGTEEATTTRVADTSSSIGTNESLEHTSRTGGRYILHVFRFNGDDPSYSLTVSVAPGTTCDDDRFDRPDAADALDPPSFNDVPTTASGVALSLDGSGESTRSLSALNLCRGDTDWFEIGIDDGSSGLSELSAGQQLQVSVASASPGPDSDVLVFGGLDPAEVELALNAEPAAEAQSFVARPTAEGRYLIAVRARTREAGPIDYTLDVTFENPPACIPDTDNDDAAGAEPLDMSGGWPESPDDPAGRADAVPLCIDDVDFYRVALDADERVIATVRYDSTAASLAMRGYNDEVLGSELRIPDVGQVDDSQIEGSGFQWLDLDLGAAGDTYFAVYNQSAWVGVYDLSVEIVPRACVDDPFDDGDGNDAWDLATPIVLAPGATPRLQSAFLPSLRMCTATGGEDDWYTVPLGPGDRLAARLFNRPDQGELDLRLRSPGPTGAGSSGTLALLDGPSSGGRFSGQIDYTVPPDFPVGDYLLQVEPRDPDGSDDFNSVYFLDLEVRRECAEDAFEPSSQETPFMLSAAGEFDAMTPRTESGALCRDEDWYAIGIPPSRTATVCLDFVHADGDIDLAVYDALSPTGPDGLPQSVVGESRTNLSRERVTFDSGSGGLFYIRAALDVLEDDKNTRYTLSVAAGNACP
ncbi:MAG: PPC domain-containing protein [Myxococcota bacterium]